MKCIIPEAKRVYLPVVGTGEFFPVRRIYCVGRNYAAHSLEMGDDPERDFPFFFCKDSSCVVPVNFSQSVEIPYPSGTTRLDYEVELVVALGSGGSRLSKEQAESSILGYAIGLDMTRRDRQEEAKKKGRPWEVGKAFDYSAPMSPIVLKNNILSNALEASAIGLKVNTVTKQLSNTSKLTWRIEDIICQLSEVFELKAGDLIMTGTPENVGPVSLGDKMLAWIENLGEITVKVAD